MLYSCKISNSCLIYFEKHHLDVEALYNTVEIPSEFLRDPSYWMQADKMEMFLSTAEQIVNRSHLQIANFTEVLGHSSAELRSWGVLDGVLRMLQRPQDIFAQPERFISYFVSPAPPIANLTRTENSLRFELPIAREEYPLTLSYLKAVIESLPSFLGQNLFQVDWQENHIEISWVTQQESIFNEATDPGHIMKPEFMQDLAASLEKSQKDLEDKNKELLMKNLELEHTKLELEKRVLESLTRDGGGIVSEVIDQGALNELNSPISYVQSNIHRMLDYMTRMQQLITLLIGQGRKDRQVQEAMRRVDYDYVVEEFPKVVEDVQIGLVKMREAIHALPQPAAKILTAKTKKENKYQQIPLN